jgi:hypothetical protein
MPSDCPDRYGGTIPEGIGGTVSLRVDRDTVSLLENAPAR